MTIDCAYDTLSKKTVAFHFPYVLLYPKVRQLYYLENRNMVLASGKRYRIANHDRELSRKKSYREANREQIRAYQRKYTEAHREQFCVYQQNYARRNQTQYAEAQASLAVVRKSLGLTQQQAADLLSVSQPLICQYERGKVPCDVEIVAEKLRTAVSEKRRNWTA